MGVDDAITTTVDYLSSDEAMKCLAVSAYWPKWDSPWWHMLLLHEMGETRRIPLATMEAFVRALNDMPVKIFPIHPGEFPEGADPYNDGPCHCQLGNVHRVLDAWGVDVDTELPWIGPWFSRYQMPDGGLNCDETAYLVANECPSSMVGTIAAFEAVTLKSHGSISVGEAEFADRAAKFMIERRVIAGSSSQHNAAERDEARAWLLPCFPRFYHYDVLRGLTALSLWAERTGRRLPGEAVLPAMTLVEQAFPDGTIRIGRRCWKGQGTIVRSDEGRWDHQRRPATIFPLLEAVSEVGVVSPYLSREWVETRRRMADVVE